MSTLVLILVEALKNQRMDEMSDEELERMAYDVIDCRPVSICMCGGEPLLRKESIYNTYSTAFGNYIGRHELLELKSCNGMPLAVLTLISEANYEKLTADNRRDWIIGTLLFLIYY